MSPDTKDLGFSYPRRHLFDGWCADFDAGLTWLQGPNGSGKSTLLQLLAGALPLRSGKLSASGIDEEAEPIAYRREVFWCGTGPIAFDHLRPSEYFGFIRGLYPRFDSGALAQHVAGFGLATQLDTRLARLSAGTQRKVWLAAAFAAETAAVLMTSLSAPSTPARSITSSACCCAAPPTRHAPGWSPATSRSVMLAHSHASFVCRSTHGLDEETRRWLPLAVFRDNPRRCSPNEPSKP